MTNRTSTLSAAMMSALGSLPVTLRTYDMGWSYHLPLAAPGGGTLKALERRGMAEYVEAAHQWRRTALGESVWEAR